MRPDYMVETSNNAALFSQVYPVLYDLASMLLCKERTNHTLQPTALINEAFLKLEKHPHSNPSKESWKSKTHFQAVAARVMRQVLVDYARQRNARKRGGDWQRVTLVCGIPGQQRSLDFEALDEAMRLLEEKDKRKCLVVELRFFGGLTCVEIANELGISPKTVEADWYFARAWLRNSLGETQEESEQ